MSSKQPPIQITQTAQTENSRLWDYTQSLLRITMCNTLQQQPQ